MISSLILFGIVVIMAISLGYLIRGLFVSKKEGKPFYLELDPNHPFRENDVLATGSSHSLVEVIKVYTGGLIKVKLII